MLRALPSTWQTCLLRDHTQILSGGTPRTKEGAYWSGTIPWITSADIVGINTIRPKRFITNEAVKESATHLIPKGNIILVSRVGLGKIAVNQSDLCISQDLQGIIVDKNAFNVYYLANYLSVVAKKFVYQNQGTAIKGILKSDLELLEIPRPPIKEQNKIATILISWDIAIERIDQLIAIKQRFKKGLMQNLLTGKLRFPKFKNYQWGHQPVGSVAEVTMGQSPDSKFYNGEQRGLPLIQGNADCCNRKTSPKVYTSQTTKKTQIGDIIMSVRAPVGTIAKCVHDACIGRGVCAIRGRKIDNEYLYQYLLAFEPRWGSLAQGSTFTAVNGSDIRKLPIYFPLEPNEQKAVACTLSLLDREIDLLSSNLSLLQQQKKGLMQKLLTGKVRVRV